LLIPKQGLGALEKGNSPKNLEKNFFLKKNGGTIFCYQAFEGTK